MLNKKELIKYFYQLSFVQLKSKKDSEVNIDEHELIDTVRQFTSRDQKENEKKIENDIK